MTRTLEPSTIDAVAFDTDRAPTHSGLEQLCCVADRSCPGFPTLSGQEELRRLVIRRIGGRTSRERPFASTSPTLEVPTQND